MTSQTLIPKKLSKLSNSADTVRQAESLPSSNPSSSNVCCLEPRKLLYQGSYQAELYHLQEATEALLQQLQALKQQRLASTLSDSEAG